MKKNTSKNRLTKTSSFIFKNNRKLFLYICRCGNSKYMYPSNVNSGKSLSCGCLASETTSKRNRKNYIVSLKEDLFEKINTEEKAYWVGFLASDGSISKNKKSLILTLSTKDRSHLIKFKNFLNSHLPIYDSVSKLKTTGKTYPTSTLKVSSSKISNSLISLGVTPNKSRTLLINLKMIPTKLIYHFWRGVIDGDGSIFISCNKWRLSLTSGSLAFLNQYVDFIKAEKIQNNISIIKNKNVNINGTNSFLLADLLYNKSTIYLDRKYEKYLEMKKRYAKDIIL